MPQLGQAVIANERFPAMDDDCGRLADARYYAAKSFRLLLLVLSVLPPERVVHSRLEVPLLPVLFIVSREII